MRERRTYRSTLLSALVVAATSTAEARAVTDDGWPRWGGPDGDFRAEARSGDWPKKGLQVRWRVAATGGHSAPVVDASRVYVVSGQGRSHLVSALDRETGALLWSHESSARFASHRPDWDGPHATPALAGDLLIVVQIDGVVRAHHRADGTLRWQRDLLTDHAVILPQSGWAASPLPHGDLVLLPGLGGTGPGALALRTADGTTAWTSGSFRSSHASPILIEPDGDPVAVFHGMDELVGVDPEIGTVLWSRPLRQGAADNVSFTPLWDASRRLLVISHRYDDIGTQAFHVPPGTATPQESPAWTQRRLQVEHGNGVLHGDLLVASHRGTPGLLLGVDLATGEVRWRERLPKATLLSLGQSTGPRVESTDREGGADKSRHLLILDESGRLHLATADGDGFGRIASFEAFDEQSWTVPTLVGRDLFLRSGSEIVAYELP